MLPRNWSTELATLTHEWVARQWHESARHTRVGLPDHVWSRTWSPETLENFDAQITRVLHVAACCIVHDMYAEGRDADGITIETRMACSPVTGRVTLTWTATYNNTCP